jgi:hypothetical protein
VSQYIEILDENEDDDDVFDLLAVSGDSDDATNERGSDLPKSIPLKELFELFADCDPTADSGVNLDNVLPLDAPAVFGDDVKVAIEHHLNVHFQLLVQSLALAGEIKDADQIWVTVLKLMVYYHKVCSRLL